MKRLVLLCLVAVVASQASANLIANGGFDDGSGNPNGTGWWSTGDATYFLNDSVTGETFARIGWWGYDQMGYEPAGLVFEADTVYTLGMDARAGDQNVATNNQYNDTVALYFYDVTNATHYVETSFKTTLTTYGDGSGWEHFDITLNTGDFPELVGHGLGIGLAAINGWAAAAWTDFDSVTLVPEPATMGLLGLGGLLLRKRR